MSEKENKVINFETGGKKNLEDGISQELLVERLDYCAKQAGLLNGLNSTEEEIKIFLKAKNFSILPGFDFLKIKISLRQQLNFYLEEKYSDYLWRT